MAKICPKYKAALIQGYLSNSNTYIAGTDILRYLASNDISLIQCDGEQCQLWEQCNFASFIAD